MNRCTELTEELNLKMVKFLRRETSVEELRLLPYLQNVMINGQCIDPNKIRRDEREILKILHKEGHIIGGTANLRITKEFWDFINEIIWMTYVPKAEMRTEDDWLKPTSQHKSFRNFMVNELGITREVIKRWTLNVVSNEVHRLSSELDIERMMRDQLEKEMGLRQGGISERWEKVINEELKKVVNENLNIGIEYTPPTQEGE